MIKCTLKNGAIPELDGVTFTLHNTILVFNSPRQVVYQIEDDDTGIIYDVSELDIQDEWEEDDD